MKKILTLLLFYFCTLLPASAAEQARGFGATLGTASTDNIVSALTSHATLRTYAFWYYHRTGGASNNRIFAKQNSGGTQTEHFLVSTGGATFTFSRSWSGGDNGWTIPFPGTNAWNHLVITYDAGNVNNNPLIYLNGASQTVTQSAGPTSGTVVTNTDNYNIGNRGAGDRVVDGMISQFAVWDRILTPTEIATLGTAAGGYNGWAPSCYATSLAEYIKLNDQPVTSSVLSNPTVTGTAQQTGLTIDYACGVVSTTVIGGRRILP